MNRSVPADATDRCDCGAVRDRSITWCSQCHAPHPPPEELPDPRYVPFSRPAAYRPLPAPRGPVLGPPGDRWRASEVTFGPIGRMVATVLVTLPLLWFLHNAVPFGFIGAITYGFVIWPWALRDIWRRTRAPRARAEPSSGEGCGPQNSGPHEIRPEGAGPEGTAGAG
jgi:hypothetical protein